MLLKPSTRPISIQPHVLLLILTSCTKTQKPEIACAERTQFRAFGFFFCEDQFDMKLHQLRGVGTESPQGGIAPLTPFNLID